ncbi:hypothetical protein [Streptomyces scabiei]|uniref:hypothetical protein n=1 Tax=Streptomyces scabiei TaxID=1930 RepID=UPI000AA03FCA|nr:hypothetical protein [Streptomyces scabiei]MDX3681400.1 hypothetical protein [Streptomyces scabiei]
MKPDQAAWVREHVWPPVWLSNHNHIPSTTFACACQAPPTLACHHGRHRACQTGEFLANETVIQNSRLRPAQFPEPYAHRTPEDRHGRRLMHGRNVLAWVWLIGTPCRQICPCACHQAVPMPTPTTVVESVQLGLFEAVAR